MPPHARPRRAEVKMRETHIKKAAAGSGSGTILEPPGGETMGSLINIFLRLAAVERNG